MRNPFRRRDRFGPVDGSSFYGRHAANPATEGTAPRRSRFQAGEHRTPEYNTRDRLRGMSEPEPKVRAPRPIRRVPSGKFRQFSDGARQGREQPRNDMRLSMRRRQRGDYPQNPSDS